MVEEILPGLVQWSAFHEGIGREVYSCFAVSSGTLIDPMEPAEGVEAIAALGRPRRIVLTNRHHYRHSARFAAEASCPVLCQEAGLDHFGEDRPVEGYAFDEQLAEGVRALQLGSICAEETALLVDSADGVLCFGDGLTRNEEGSLAFMPDRLLGDDPAGVRAGLCRSLRRIHAEEDFDGLLFAHAPAVLEGGHALLGEFLDRTSAPATARPVPIL